MWRRFFTVSLAFLLVISVRAEDSSSLQKVLGEWEVKMRVLGSRKARSTLFPSKSNALLPPQSRLKCTLTLLPNGEFVLRPLTRIASEGDAEDVLPIRGKWVFQKNPYCATDRFYDEITLQSFARVLKRRGESDEPEDEILQRLSFQLKCRVYGRLTDQSSSSRIRLTHGSVLRKDELGEKPNNLLGWWRQRKVCGTFTGKPTATRQDSE